MKIILIKNPKAASANLVLGKWSLVALASLLLMLPLGFGVASYHLSKYVDDPAVSSEIAHRWQQDIAAQKRQLEVLSKASTGDLEALTIKLAEAQARLLRVEALGERLVSVSKIKSGEFDFSTRPALGGQMVQAEGEAFEPRGFMTEIDSLIDDIEGKERQLAVLQSVLEDKVLKNEVFLAGRPIRKGWMSSFFGKRIDPFNGRLAQHKGIDFAGKEGADVIAVASGVVTWSGDRHGYGLMVELDHGGGYVTRYAHNKENNVSLGEIVHKGQTLGKMGSSGRSTGPHVHFEVLRNGRAVNPERYVYRNNLSS